MVCLHLLFIWLRSSFTLMRFYRRIIWFFGQCPSPAGVLSVPQDLHIYLFFLTQDGASRMRSITSIHQHLNWNQGATMDLISIQVQRYWRCKDPTFQQVADSKFVNLLAEVALLKSSIKKSHPRILFKELLWDEQIGEGGGVSHLCHQVSKGIGSDSLGSVWPACGWGVRNTRHHSFSIHPCLEFFFFFFFLIKSKQGQKGKTLTHYSTA